MRLFRQPTPSCGRNCSNTVKKKLPTCKALEVWKKISFGFDAKRCRNYCFETTTAQSVRFLLYKHARKSYSNLIFVLSAANFNQAYKRLKYLRYINQSTKAQVAAIEQTNVLARNGVFGQRKVLYADEWLGLVGTGRARGGKDKTFRECITRLAKYQYRNRPRMPADGGSFRL